MSGTAGDGAAWAIVGLHSDYFVSMSSAPDMPTAVATVTPTIAGTACAQHVHSTYAGTPAPIAVATAVAIPTGPPVATGFAVQASGSGGYEQFPPLCDFCSAGNNICCYATFCTPCLAGQMFTNVIGRPGCCMRLSVLYTICAIFGYVLLAIAAAPMERDDGEQGDEGEDDSPRPIPITGYAELAGRVASFVASALLCWTLVKASPPPATQPYRVIIALSLLSCLLLSHGAHQTKLPSHGTTYRSGAQVRQALRNRSGGRLHGNSCEDCVLSWFCTCCTTIQLARYLGWEDKPYNVCSPTGVPESIPV